MSTELKNLCLALLGCFYCNGFFATDAPTNTDLNGKLI
jgi:hypothetical protein